MSDTVSSPVLATLQVGGNVLIASTSPTDPYAVLFTDTAGIGLQLHCNTNQVVHLANGQAFASVHLRIEGATALRDALDHLLGDRP